MVFIYFRSYILAPGKGISHLFLNSQNICELEKPALVFICCRIFNANETTALINPFPDPFNNIRIGPMHAAAPGAIGVAPIYNYTYVITNWLFADVIKADKFHLRRQTTQTFWNMSFRPIVIMHP